MDGRADAARFYEPQAMYFDATGTLWLGEYDEIRKITFAPCSN